MYAVLFESGQVPTTFLCWCEYRFRDYLTINLVMNHSPPGLTTAPCTETDIGSAQVQSHNHTYILSLLCKLHVYTRTCLFTVSSPNPNNPHHTAHPVLNVFNLPCGGGNQIAPPPSAAGIHRVMSSSLGEQSRPAQDPFGVAMHL